MVKNHQFTPKSSQDHEQDLSPQISIGHSRRLRISSRQIIPSYNLAFYLGLQMPQITPIHPTIGLFRGEL